MTRAILSRLAVVVGIAFLALCWSYAGLGAFRMLTQVRHAKHAPVDFCEVER